MKKQLFLLLSIGLLTSCGTILNTISGVNAKEVIITNIRLVSFPDKLPNGESYDPLGGLPDIYCRVPEENLRTAVQTDVPLRQSVDWNLSKGPWVFKQLSANYRFEFLDQESGLNFSTPDMIGSVVFNPSKYTGRSMVTLSSQTAPNLKVELSLQWK